MSGPWYAAGLAFECVDGCGRCCRGPGGYVWLREAEAEAIAGALRMPLADFGKRYLRRTAHGLALRDGRGGDCILLGEDGRCRVYGERPAQCRTFPWWQEVVESPESWNRWTSRCPGLNRGRKRPLAEIEAGLARQLAAETTEEED